jgi:hypothetical protein
MEGRNITRYFVWLWPVRNGIRDKPHYAEKRLIKFLCPNGCITCQQRILVGLMPIRFNSLFTFYQRKLIGPII